MLSLVSTSTVHIAIEAHIDDDEIRGQIRGDAGPTGSFSGWLGLISALDTLLSPRPGADSAGGAHEGRGRPRHEPQPPAADVNDKNSVVDAEAQ
jgi:hypothetical protein